MSDNEDESLALAGVAKAAAAVSAGTAKMESGANGFARAMTNAFAQSIAGGKQFDDILKSLALRLSDLSLKLALKPVTDKLASGLEGIFGSLLGSAKPNAKGGIIGTPTYFPLDGGFGLAGEAGPEAILPLARGSDGRLGVAAGGGGGGASVTVQIATPDAESFRRSETYLTGLIARAVARGQRGL